MMLEDWIYKGQINDPYHEFMIIEDKDITKDKLKDDFNEKYPFICFFFINLFFFKIILNNFLKRFGIKNTL
jgi:hypothetical protein